MAKTKNSIFVLQYFSCLLVCEFVVETDFLDLIFSILSILTCVSIMRNSTSRCMFTHSIADRISHNKSSAQGHISFKILYIYGLGMGEERGVCRVLLGKPEGRRPLGRPRCRWVDNIRMDLQEVGCGYMDWIGLAQDRDRWRTFVSAVMNLRVP